MDRILPLRDFSEYFQIIEYDELLINNQQLPPDKTEFICSSERFPEQSVDGFVPLRPCTSYISWQLNSNDCCCFFYHHYNVNLTSKVIESLYFRLVRHWL